MNRVAPLFVVALALVLSACGGESGAETSTAPALPAGVAQDLADQADAIAASYESGDECTAAEQADSLNDSVIDAINAGKVPPELQESLQATANKLVNEINCPPPAPTTEEQPQDCAALEEQKQALEDEKDATESKGQEKQLEKQIEALDEQIKACEDGGEEGEG